MTMPSDARRLDEVLRHLERIRGGTYPQIIDLGGGFKILDRLWRDVPERNKLLILQGTVAWSGISDRDQAHILLGAIDPGRITRSQRDRLVRVAAAPEKPARQGRGLEHDRCGGEP